MKFVLITHVPHLIKDNVYYAYGPYVKEMNIWLQYADEVLIVAPVSTANLSAIELPYQHSNIKFYAVPAFSLLSVTKILKTIWMLPQLFGKVYTIMKAADHIHLRCPGNMGLIGCLVQILFPKKAKTAKYAGNWDPKSKQPWSYRLQKWILNNTWLTRNMKVLVYGEWKGAGKNVVPFFTATYKESDKKEIPLRNTNGVIKLLFVGTLSKGKQPLYAVQLAENLLLSGYDVTLDMYGEGVEREKIEDYLKQKNLQGKIVLHGNKSAGTVEKAYQESHFLILPSQSEGWPKVVAEAMFWGCVPMATNVSCIPTMLANGKRGIGLTLSVDHDMERIKQNINDNKSYQQKAKLAMEWSRQYTLDYFESEIQKMLKDTRY